MRSASCGENLANNFIRNATPIAIQSTESERSRDEFFRRGLSPCCTLRMRNITEADWCNESEAGEIIEFTGMQIALRRINYLARRRLKKQPHQQQQAVAAEASVCASTARKYASQKVENDTLSYYTCT
jgi:hypothetical protein